MLCYIVSCITLLKLTNINAQHPGMKCDLKHVDANRFCGILNITGISQFGLVVTPLGVSMKLLYVEPGLHWDGCPYSGMSLVFNQVTQAAA